MEKEFVPHNPALRLKAIGFDELCVYYVDKNNNSYIYNFQTHPDEFIEWCGVNVIPTPTFSQAFRWFRDKYEIHSFIDCKWKNTGWEYELVDLNKMETISSIGKYGYKNPEEAELACLTKLIEIIESK